MEERPFIEFKNLINDELKSIKHILNVLPDKHLFKFMAGDHKTMGYVGIYDLLLHKRDVSYSSTEVYEWLQRSGYNVVDASSPDNTNPISLKDLIKDKLFFDKINRLDLPF